MKFDFVIIGGGVAGTAVARELAALGGSVAIIEAGSQLGSGVRTNWYGGHPYTFGPRHFITKNQEVFNWLNDIVPLRDCSEHIFLSYVEMDNQFYNFPISKDDVKRMPDKQRIYKELASDNDFLPGDTFVDYWIKSVGPTLYSKIIEKYTKKMWMIEDNREFDIFKWSEKGTAIKESGIGVFDDRFSGYPRASNGYNDLFDDLPNGITKRLGETVIKVDQAKKIIVTNEAQYSYGVCVNTISPDLIIADEQLDPLPYIGRDFHKIVFPSETVFPDDVYFLYYPNDESFTRMVEYKKFTKHVSNTTLIGLEMPSLNGRHYPLPMKKWLDLAGAYHERFSADHFSIGRAGSYRYLVDIDDCIEQAIAVARIVQSGGWEHPVPDAKWRAYF